MIVRNQRTISEEWDAWSLACEFEKWEEPTLKVPCENAIMTTKLDGYPDEEFEHCLELLLKLIKRRREHGLPIPDCSIMVKGNLRRIAIECDKIERHELAKEGWPGDQSEISDGIPSPVDKSHDDTDRNLK